MADQVRNDGTVIVILTLPVAVILTKVRICVLVFEIKNGKASCCLYYG
jgi:hypothetical protein